jgi:hypothetical protein
LFGVGLLGGVLGELCAEDLFCEGGKGIFVGVEANDANGGPGLRDGGFQGKADGEGRFADACDADEGENAAVILQFLDEAIKQGFPPDPAGFVIFEVGRL